MNPTIKAFAVSKIKEGLKTLPEGWQNTFRLMYGKKKNDTDPIDAVVDAINEEKLDWALTQVENSLKKLQKKAEELKNNEKSS